MAATAHWIAGKVNDDATVPYAVVDLRSEQAVGIVSYMAIEREMGTVEIGHVTVATDEKHPAGYRSGLAAAQKRL